ncbi:hypothetical protein [Seonamhaeicola sp.]|uniref:hypothetical protein n=1 Tax=Seonamhaeicola sp. TaxID=1912245 RepID=UPI00260A9A6F|nr:hypothetical protein [Seonamhaeicola sp.]
MTKNSTTYDKIILKFKQNKLLSIILVAGTVIIAIGSFTDSIDKISKVFNLEPKDNAEVEIFYKAIEKHLESRGRKSTHQEVVDYAEYMAKESELLASAWDEIVNSLINGAVNNDTLKIKEIRTKYKSGLRINGMLFTRITELYSIYQNDPNHKSHEWVEKISLSVAEIIHWREISVEGLEEVLNSLDNPEFFDAQNTFDQLKSLSQSVEVLKKESAKIHALSLAIKMKVPNNK